LLEAAWCIMLICIWEKCMVRSRLVQALVASSVALALAGCGKTTRDFTQSETGSTDGDGAPAEPATTDQPGGGAGQEPASVTSAAPAQPPQIVTELPPATVVVGPESTLTGLPECEPGGAYPAVIGTPWQAVVSHSGRFASAPDYTLTVQHPSTVFFIDLDSDGLTDLGLSHTRSLTFLRQQPAGSFTPSAAIEITGDAYIETCAIHDLDEDGAQDVVLYAQSSPFSRQLRVYFQQQDGFAREPDQTVVIAEDPTIDCFTTYYVGVGDVTGDGRVDIVADSALGRSVGESLSCSYGEGIVQVIAQAPDGSFSLHQELRPDTEGLDCTVCPRHFAVADWNGDSVNEFVLQQNGLRDGLGPWEGTFRILSYEQRDGLLSEPPTLLAELERTPASIWLQDVNADNRTDLVARVPGDFTATTLDVDEVFYEGYSAVFLQEEQSRFSAEHPVTLSGQQPVVDYYIHQGHDTLSLALVDVNADEALDYAAERERDTDGLFIQEHGRFPLEPDVAVEQLCAEHLERTEQTIAIEFEPSEGAPLGMSLHERFEHRFWDLNGDGLEDLVALFTPFSPNRDPDPGTGLYPYDGFEALSRTEISVHLQRTPERKLMVEVEDVQVEVDGDVMRVRAVVRNISHRTASDVRARLLATEYWPEFTYDLGMLDTQLDELAQWIREDMPRAYTSPEGMSLGELELGRIEPNQGKTFVAEMPACRTSDLAAWALFIVIDPEQSQNLLYRTSYDFLGSR
jgi:hypothetical protein